MADRTTAPKPSLGRLPLLLAAWAAAAGLFALPARGGDQDDLTGARKQQLGHLLKHDCGSCHGLTLAGGLGPALTPEAVAQKSDDLLRHTILYGRPGTPMPPFAGMLSEREIDWLIAAMRGNAR